MSDFEFFIYSFLLIFACLHIGAMVPALYARMKLILEWFRERRNNK